MTTSTSIPRPQSVINELRIPPHPEVWKQVRVMVADTMLRIGNTADIAQQDVSLVIEFLRVASSMEFSAGKPAATNLKTAIERLGGKASIEMLEEMKAYPFPEDASALPWLEAYRDKCRRAGQVARIFAELITPTLVDDAHCSGNMIFIGDLLAIMHFGADYVKLAKELPRAKVLYRLEKDAKFDIKKVGINYIKKAGIPDLVVQPLDEAAQIKISSRAPLKLVMSCTEEVMMAFDGDRWDKYSPNVSIPNVSNIRLLKMTEQQYAALYEKLNVYLVQEKQKAEKAGLLLVK